MRGPVPRRIILTDAQQQLAIDNRGIAYEAVKQFLLEHPWLRPLRGEFNAIAMHKLCRAAGSYAPGPCKFSTFAFIAVTNALLNELKLRCRHGLNQERKYGLDADATKLRYRLADRSGGPDARVDAIDLWRQMMPLLTNQERRVVELKLIGGENFVEIATEMHVSSQRVRQIYVAAIERCRRAIDLDEHSSRGRIPKPARN